MMPILPVYLLEDLHNDGMNRTICMPSWYLLMFTNIFTPFSKYAMHSVVCSHYYMHSSVI
jgi:hypothetical protein